MLPPSTNENLVDRGEIQLNEMEIAAGEKLKPLLEGLAQRGYPSSDILAVRIAVSASLSPFNPLLGRAERNLHLDFSIRDDRVRIRLHSSKFTARELQRVHRWFMNLPLLEFVTSSRRTRTTDGALEFVRQKTAVQTVRLVSSVAGRVLP